MRVYVILVIGLRIVGAASTFAVSLAVSRVLGVDNAGQFILSINAALFLGIVARQGADSLALKFVAIFANEKRSDAIFIFLKHQFLMSGALSLVLIFIVYLFFGYIPLPEKISSFASMWIWFAPAVFFLSLMGIISSSFQALNWTMAAIFFQALGVNIFVLFGVLLGIATGPGLAIVFFVSTLVIVCLGVLGLMRLLRQMASCSLSDSKSDKNVEVQGSQRAFWIIAILQNLQIWGAQYVAGAVLPSSELSSLVIAQQCSLTLTLVLQAIIMIYGPRFAVLHQDGKLSDLQSLYRKVVALITVTITPLVLFLVILPGSVLDVFGKGFEDGAVALQILAFGQLLNAMAGPVGMLLMMTGYEKVYRKLFIIVVPVGLFGATGLGLSFGINGFAMATAANLVITNLIAIYLVRRYLKISLLPWFGLK